MCLLTIWNYLLLTICSKVTLCVLSIFLNMLVVPNIGISHGPPRLTPTICVVTCHIFAFPNSHYSISSLLRVCEIFGKRFLPEKTVLVDFLGSAELAEPFYGFRQYKFWEFQNTSHGTGGTQNWVPPVQSEGSASCPEKFRKI